MGKLQITREKLKCCAEHLRYYSSYHSCYSSDSGARARARGPKLVSDSFVSGASPRTRYTHAIGPIDMVCGTLRDILQSSPSIGPFALLLLLFGRDSLSGSVWRKTRLLAGVAVGLDFEFYGRWLYLITHDLDSLCRVRGSRTRGR